MNRIRNHFETKLGHCVCLFVCVSAPPDVLEIPWREMLSVVGVLGMFVLGNFIWW